MRIFVCLFGALILFIFPAVGQIDSTANNIAQFPNRIFVKLNTKASSLDDALTRQTEKYLQRLAKKERKIQERLYKLDSNAAKNLFNGTQAKYTSLQNNITAATSTDGTPLKGEYVPYVDSIKSSLAFAQKFPDMLNASPKIQAEVAASLAQFNKLQNKFSNADQVKAYIQQRKQAFKDQLQQYMQNSGLKKELDKYNQQVYYYSQQVREYKEALNDPDKMLEKALVILNKIPAFTHFIQQNGQLAGLFGIAGNYGSADGVVGLQTRDQVQQLLQGQISGGSAGGMAALQSNLESAHQQLDQFKDKLSKLGSGSGDMSMPDFKPNDQKTHSILKRLEIGTNFQTTRANYYFPTTTDFGLSIGYKLNDKSTIGVGGSYNVGWGQNINHIHITSNGASLRSFVDVKLKKNIYFSGGYELNYQQAFTSFSQISSITDWSRSGLIGLSKMVSLPGKMIKKTKVQLFWDFLSYTQMPRTQPFKFRVGYNF
jgi:ATP-dependent protease HslVU (ClpYQ) peptidase subunit